MHRYESILSPDGPLASTLGNGFESRHEQVHMARAVWETLERRSHLLVEAGTGVGKSFAYLIPAITRAIDHNETVLIATNTISLQEQLITKDIPLLQAILDPVGEAEQPADPTVEGPQRRLRPVLVKGRGNYVSIRRLSLASARQERLLADPPARRSLHVIEDWAQTTLDGTLSTLPPLERPGVWDKVQSDSGNCMGRKCPQHAACFYQNARRAMDGANLLICNHALFFSDLALRSQEVGFLPKYDHVILDEAHGVEDAASDHFGVSLSEGRVMHLLTTLYHPRTGRGYLAQSALATGDTAAIDRAVRLVLEAMDVCRQFFESLVQVARESAKGAPEKPWQAAGQTGAVSARIRKPAVVPNQLTEVMNNLTIRLRSMREACKNDQDQYELNAYAIRASMIADDAASLIDQSLPGYAYWVEAGSASDDSAFQKVTLACSPIEVAPLLKQRLFSQPHSVILTSATLSTRRVAEDESTESAEMAFAHTITRLGCEGARTLQLGSPFDHSAQAELVIDTGAGSPAASSGREHSYVDTLAERIVHHVQETDGGAFVLFTSFATLNAVARRIRPRLEMLGMQVLGQGLDGPRQAILEKFRADERSVLLGAASFWQGVDVRGRGLRNVIITKLPFDPPDRPLTEARTELMQARGQDPFREDALPRAVMKFKQGFGRLIRSKTDHGRVVVLDPRIVTARYGSAFLRSLPDGIPIRRT
ncbi:MAG: putative ATP-dependent helicase DinG [Phycisphaerales bacterium]|nr:putative ATP-dependent helicase DinG [Phycisphaerales bacterium]